MVATTPHEERHRSGIGQLELGTLLPGMLLGLMMIWAVFRSIADARWSVGIDLVVDVALLGLLLGVVFARARWLPSWVAHPLAILLGVALAVQRVAPTLVDTVREDSGATLAGRLTNWPDWAGEIALRSVVWGRVLAAGGRGEDIVLYLLTLALLAWFAGYATAWLLFRSEQLWLAVVLNASIILANYTFAYPKPTLLFFVFLASALLLVVYQNIVRQQRIWRAARVEYPDLLAWRFLIAAAMVCAVVIGLTSLIPSQVSSTEAQQAWRAIRSPFSTVRERWNDAFSTINAPPGTSGSFVVRTSRVGGPRSPGDAVVMRVKSEKYEYWRAVSFDRYTGRFWQNTVGERSRAALGVATPEEARTPLAANVPLSMPAIRETKTVTQTVTLVQLRNDGLVLSGGQFVAASVPVVVEHGYIASGAEQRPNMAETVAVLTDQSLEEGTVYTVRSLFSNADEQSLRAASSAYPTWVTDSYLQLPDALPPRVGALAKQVVADAKAENTYDSALAIQNYLRRLTYDERRTAPPDNRDWVDYFVFDGKVGYCDDFATAMVVLLRSERIPARWVQGYAGGTRDQQTGEYVVRENQAHSWVEVYFPGYGWQRFEPTPAPYASAPVRPALPTAGSDSQDTANTAGGELTDPEELVRRLQELNRGPEQTPEQIAALKAELEQRERDRQRQQWIIYGAGAAVLLLLAVGFWIVLALPLRGLTAAQTAYARLIRLGRWAGAIQDETATPLEYGRELVRAVPEQRRLIERVVDGYIASAYGRGAVDTVAMTAALRDLRRPFLLRALGRLAFWRRPAAHPLKRTS